MTAEALLNLISHLSLLVSTLILCLIGKSMVGVIRLMRKELWELRGLIASHITRTRGAGCSIARSANTD